MKNTKYDQLYGDLLCDLACSSVFLEGHTSIHRLGPSCIRHWRCQNNLKRQSSRYSYNRRKQQHLRRKENTEQS